MEQTQNTQPNQSLFSRSFILLFVINVIISISFAMISTTMSLYVTGFGQSTAVAGTVIGAFSIATLCMRLFSGVLSDRLNRKWLLIAALLGICAAMMGYGTTQSIPALMALRVLHGLSFSVASTVTMALIAPTIPAGKMSQGLGVFAVGQTIAYAVAPSTGMWIAEAYNFRYVFWFAALLNTLAVIMTVIFVRYVKPPQKPAHKRTALADFVAVEAIPYALLSVILSIASGLELSFVVLYGKELGLGTVGWYFTINAVMLFITRIGGGWLADKNAFLVTIVGFCLIVLFYLVMGASTSATGFVFFTIAAIIKAVGQGILQPLLQASSLKATDPSRHGVASCTYYFGADAGQAIAPVVGGLIVTSQGYHTMFYFFAAATAVAIAVYGYKMKSRLNAGIASGQ